MKKIIKAILVFLIIIPGFVFAKTTKVVDTNNRVVVTLENCSTVSNIWINESGETKRIALLAYDTDSTTLNTEINNYVASKLKNASLIEIEYDVNNDEKDDYNRELVWVYVDGVLLQDQLISMGYGKVNYVNGNYSYLKTICKSEKNAIKENKGIWQLGAADVYCNATYTEESNDLEANLSNSEKFNQSVLYKLVFVSILLLGLLFLLKGKRINEKK